MLGLDGLHPSSRWDKWISSRERCVVVAPDIISHHVLVALVVGVARLQVGAAVLVVVRHEVRLEVQLEVKPPPSHLGLPTLQLGLLFRKYGASRCAGVLFVSPMSRCPGVTAI